MTTRIRPPAEWPATLDVAALAARGWRPVPFRQFVLKLFGRCDLACDYCYMFAMTDQSWRTAPVAMPGHVVTAAAQRIAAHATRHDLRSVAVVLHGGEPLLAGAEAIALIATTLRRRLPEAINLDLRVQTNGTRLDEPLLATLAAHHIRVGVSLDGGEREHDRHRRYASGRGSFAAVRAGLARLRAGYPELFAGLLCTIDVRNDPVRTYEALLEFAPPAVDLLLPHGNWSQPPPGRSPGDPATPYGDWLVAVFDRWYQAPSKETAVRIFEEIIHLSLGGASRIESIGLSPTAVAVIATDGAIEVLDTLRSAHAGAVGTGLNVVTDELDAALAHPGVAARQIGRAALSDTCLACPVHRVCGGGYYPHRYRRDAGFRNPSVYCPDLRRLIDHIHRRVWEDMTANASRQC